jgi:transposase
MASIVRKIKKGRPYYYAVESGRVDGKPRIVWQKYLGTLDKIIARADESKPPKPKQAVIFQAGGVAALSRVAQRLGLMELLNQVLPKRDQGPTVGHYIVLAALNRALAPTSKARIGDWYEQSVLRRLWRFEKSDFSSQRFWDHMDRINEKDIDSIQEKLFARIQDNFAIDARLLLYDTTNFFTFLATTNERCELAQRGRNKQKRHDLRQLGLALLVSGDFQIPLFHHVYAGNTPDVSVFPELTSQLVERYEKLTGARSEATLVFDKGNVSDDAMEDLVVAPIHLVAALSAGRCADLLATPIEQFDAVAGAPGTRAFVTTTDHWSTTCRAAVVYTESFFTQQLNGVTVNLVKCQKKLSDLAKSLERWRKGKGRGKRPTLAGVKKSVARILSPQFMKQLIVTDVKPAKEAPNLTYRVDHGALEQLARKRLGRTVIVTDHRDWGAEQIVAAYRGLSSVEDTFKNMKNVDYLRWRPSFHWTDGKLRVHALYCVLALLLSSLARQEAAKSGVDLTLRALLDELTNIREVAVIYPSGTLAHRKDHVTLSRMSPRQKKLARILEIDNILYPEG